MGKKKKKDLCTLFDNKTKPENLSAPSHQAKNLALSQFMIRLYIVRGLQRSCAGCKWRWRFRPPLISAHDRWSPQTRLYGAWVAGRANFTLLPGKILRFHCVLKNHVSDKNPELWCWYTGAERCTQPSQHTNRYQSPCTTSQLVTDLFSYINYSLFYMCKWVEVSFWR